MMQVLDYVPYDAGTGLRTMQVLDYVPYDAGTGLRTL